MPSRRVFSEQQVSEIIRRAADHQVRQRPAGAPAASGISEDELMHVAKELGIDPESLQLAMSEVSADGLGDTGTISSLDRVLERTFDGDVNAEDLAVVLQEFTPIESFSNKPTGTGNSLSYTSIVGLAQCRVNVMNRRGRTTLRVKSHGFLAGIVTFIPAVGLSMIANIIIWEEIKATLAEGLPFAFLIPIFFLIVAFMSFRQIVRYSNRKVLDLTNRTATKLSESVDDLRGNISRSGIPLPGVEASAEETRLQ